MKKIIANVYTNNGTTTEFEEVIEALSKAGYEIAWSQYPVNAAVIAEVSEEEH